MTLTERGYDVVNHTITLGSLYIDGQPVQAGTQYNQQTFEIGDLMPKYPLSWVPVLGAFFCTWNLLTNISWNDLDRKGLIFGGKVQIDHFSFRCRVPRGGSANTDLSEWNVAMEIDYGDNALWHWKDMYSWCQEEAASDPSSRVCRGGNWPHEQYRVRPGSWFPSCGWRPVLEPIGYSGVPDRVLQVGHDLLIWDGNTCIRGTLEEETPYDLILSSWPIWGAEKDGFYKTLSDDAVAVDKASIKCLQVGKVI